MSDDTLVNVDNEPWNVQEQSPRERGPRLVPSHVSVYDRVRRGILIQGPGGVVAGFVYDVVVGYGNESERCDDCGELELCNGWQEWEQVAAKRGDKPYAARRNINLCEACGSALRALPIGRRWQRRRRASDRNVAIAALNKIRADLAAINPMNAACAAVNIVDEEIKRLSGSS